MDPNELFREGRPLDALEAAGAEIGSIRAHLGRMLLWRVAVLTDLERWGEALVDLDMALALAPPDGLVGLVGTRGWVLSRLGRHAEALAQVDRAFDMGSDDDWTVARLHVNRGLALSGLGDLRGALREYDAAEGRAPRDPVVSYDRACVLSKLGRGGEALASLRRAVRLDASWRVTARRDRDFDDLRSDPTCARRFRELVGADD
jgi:tetratricopeptide (TPR) repeat protein